MYNELLITILLIIVSVLLVLDIIIALQVLRILKTVRRATVVVDKVLDDLEKFGKIISKFHVPFSWAGLIKKVAARLTGPSSSATKDKDKE